MRSTPTSSCDFTFSESPPSRGLPHVTTEPAAVMAATAPPPLCAKTRVEFSTKMVRTSPSASLASDADAKAVTRSPSGESRAQLEGATASLRAATRTKPSRGSSPSRKNRCKMFSPLARATETVGMAHDEGTAHDEGDKQFSGRRLLRCCAIVPCMLCQWRCEMYLTAQRPLTQKHWCTPFGVFFFQATLKKS